MYKIFNKNNNKLKTHIHTLPMKSNITLTI